MCMQEETRSPLAARFERFALECAKQDSPFYERLSKHVANDDELLTMAAHASRPPIPNVFFGAVHYPRREILTATLVDSYDS